MICVFFLMTGNSTCTTTPHLYFYCPTTATCILLSQTCDTINDCGMYEDEKGCTPCTSSQIFCGGTKCIPDSLACDKANDCGSQYPYIDEQGCKSYVFRINTCIFRPFPPIKPQPNRVCLYSLILNQSLF